MSDRIALTMFTARCTRTIPFFLVALIGLVVLSCSSPETPPSTKAEWMYLGIPADEEYPNPKYQLTNSVPQEKYWRVLRVSHVSKEEYDRDVAAGRMLYRDAHSGTQYYATELTGDFFQTEKIRAWVTILERKAYP